MTELLQKAIAEIRKLPDEEQDAIATRILEELVQPQEEQQDPFQIMLQMAEEADLPFAETDISERSRDILKHQYADYLIRRMQPNDDKE